MGGKLKNLEFAKQIYKPGPGAHTPSHRNDIATMVFGTGQRGSLENLGGKLSQGPGAYNDQSPRVLKTAPKFGFGTSSRQAQKRLDVPGPGNYQAKKFVGKDLPAYSMAGLSTYSPERKEGAHKPGPGNYSPGTGYVKRTEPSYAIGKGLRTDAEAEKQKTFQTAPGQDDPKPEATRMKAAGWRIGTENRPGMVPRGAEKVPGAGTYAIRSSIDSGPKVGMHAKLEDIEFKKQIYKPGAGQYNLQNSPGLRNKRAAAYSMGSSSRVDLANTKQSKFVPGPGAFA